MEARDILEDLVLLDEVYKRLRVDPINWEDKKFARELLGRIKEYEQETGKDLSLLVNLAKEGKFCPMLSDKIRLKYE